MSIFAFIIICNVSSSFLKKNKDWRRCSKKLYVIFSPLYFDGLLIYQDRLLHALQIFWFAAPDFWPHFCWSRWRVTQMFWEAQCSHPCYIPVALLCRSSDKFTHSHPVFLSLLHSYVEEAVMHLDQSDPITRDHMGSVMNQVRQKLFQFLQTEPQNSLSKPARRLMIMLQGLVTPSMCWQGSDYHCTMAPGIANWTWLLFSFFHLLEHTRGEK